MTAIIGIVRRTRQLRQSGPIFSFIQTKPYVGPGDVVTGAAAWWGLRAYNLNKAGTKAINIRASGDNATTDINTLSNGNLDVATISSFLTTHGGSAFVTKLFDQTGGGTDLTQTTAANQPGLTLSGLGSLPIMTFSGSQNIDNTTFAGNLAVTPCTFSSVSQRTNTTGAFAIGATSGNEGIFHHGANIIACLSTTFLDSTIGSDNAWHASQGIANGASSSINIDGTTTTGTTGANNISTNIGLGDGGNGSFQLTGDVVEGGLWNFAFTGGQVSSMNSNQHNYWGF